MINAQNTLFLFLIGLLVVVVIVDDYLIAIDYKTPFVLGTSLDWVYSVACRSASARALKAHSALLFHE